MRIGVTANVGGDPERVRYPVVALWPGYPTSSLAVWVMRNSLVPNDRQPAAAPTAWLDGAKRGGGLAHPYPISRPQRRSDCAVGPDGNGWDALKRGSGWPPTSRPMVSVGTFASPRSCTAPRWAGTSTFTLSCSWTVNSISSPCAGLKLRAPPGLPAALLAVEAMRRLTVKTCDRWLQAPRKGWPAASPRFGQTTPVPI